MPGCDASRGICLDFVIADYLALAEVGADDANGDDQEE
jgi:hypothetical protein